MTDSRITGTLEDMLAKGIELVPYRKAIPHSEPVEDVETAFWRSFLYLFGALGLEEQLFIVKRDILGREFIWHTDEGALERWQEFYDPLLRDMVQMCNFSHDTDCAVLIRQVLANQIPQDRNIWDAIFGIMSVCPNISARSIANLTEHRAA